MHFFNPAITSIKFFGAGCRESFPELDARAFTSSMEFATLSLFFGQKTAAEKRQYCSNAWRTKERRPTITDIGIFY